MPTSMRTAMLALALLLVGCTADRAVESPSVQPSVAATASPTSTQGASPEPADLAISPAQQDAIVDIAAGYGELGELLGRHPYFVDGVVPRSDGSVDVYMWFHDEVPIEEWPLGPPCVATDPFTGVHAVVDIDTETVVAASPRWGIGTCIALAPR